uniref:Uncharacterized protein n=1 Tax=Populus trichocarpa TaxID=3694 RepID=A0A2K2BH45_POPTR
MHANIMLQLDEDINKEIGKRLFDIRHLRCMHLYCNRFNHHSQCFANFYIFHIHCLRLCSVIPPLCFI